MTEAELCTYVARLFEQRRDGAVFTPDQLRDLRQRLDLARRPRGTLGPFATKVRQLLDAVEGGRRLDDAMMRALQRDLERQLELDSSWSTPSEVQQSKTVAIASGDLHKLLDERVEQQSETTQMNADDLRRLIEETSDKPPR